VGQFQVTPGRLVDLHHRALGQPSGRAQVGKGALLGQGDVVDQRAGRRRLRPGEGAERFQRLDLECLLQALAGVLAVEPAARQRGQQRLPGLQRLLDLGAGEQALGDQQFARVEPGERGRQPVGLGRLGLEVTG
jgi:hypothetical protein